MSRIGDRKRWNSLARKAKLKRLRRGGLPRVLDLFAGCGGLSLGFHAAGFEIAAAVESDPIAAKTHALNFHGRLPPHEQASHARARDIQVTDPEDLVSELGFGTDVAVSVDVVVGGPPCQAFARVGRAKLREVATHPEAYRHDPRANLYLRYLDYVEQFQPLALLVENVPDVLSFAGNNIPQVMCEALAERRYVCRYTLLNAAYYGVPQMRERMFLLAYAEELECEPAFPVPTHWIDLPKGYEGMRQVALRLLAGDLFSNGQSFYGEPSQASPRLPAAVTAEQALGDLPPITLHLEGKLRRGARRFHDLMPYPKHACPSLYAGLMRGWPGFENAEGIRDHVIRSLPRDYAIFKRMKPGDQYPQAFQHATDLLNETLRLLDARGRSVEAGSIEYANLQKQIIPPYDPGKFPNKWRKMEANQPARTLMAHLGKDSYSHVHYDSSQARTISVREAARLQSFPDGFVFCGTMNPAFRQIGNAVPPLMANALAHAMLAAMGVDPARPPLVNRFLRGVKR